MWLSWFTGCQSRQEDLAKAGGLDPKQSGPPFGNREISWPFFVEGLRYGGFLKWWYRTTMGFPTNNDHFGVFWGDHHLRKHPYIRCYFGNTTGAIFPQSPNLYSVIGCRILHIWHKQFNQTHQPTNQTNTKH